MISPSSRSRPLQALLLPGVAFLFACLAPVSLRASEPAPDAAEILRAARLNQIQGHARLSAQLRSGRERVPFEILLENGEITYRFQEPAEDIVLRLGEENSELFLRSGGKESPLRRAEGGATVRGTRLTQEDLSLRFLYWPGVRLLGTETFRTRPSWKLELHPRDKNSFYGAVRVWVDQESGALLRIEGYDRDGRLVRRFEVASVQRIEGQYYLKSMRVETFDPSTLPAKLLERAYLEILDVGTPGS
jgi:hypothetical protein